MNSKAIFEIGNIIRITKNWKLQKLSEKEILNSFEYKQFKEKYPELCKFCEGKNKA